MTNPENTPTKRTNKERWEYIELKESELKGVDLNDGIDLEHLELMEIYALQRETDMAVMRELFEYLETLKGRDGISKEMHSTLIEYRKEARKKELDLIQG